MNHIRQTLIRWLGGERVHVLVVDKRRRVATRHISIQTAEKGTKYIANLGVGLGSIEFDPETSRVEWKEGRV